MPDSPATNGGSSGGPGSPSGSRFARLPRLAGRSFLPLGIFARLPLAMLTVGTLTLVTSNSGSYALGGTAAGAVGIGSALGAPILGTLADRRGQRPVLIFAITSRFSRSTIATWSAAVSATYSSFSSGESAKPCGWKPTLIAPAGNNFSPATWKI